MIIVVNYDFVSVFQTKNTEKWAVNFEFKITLLINIKTSKPWENNFAEYQ